MTSSASTSAMTRPIRIWAEMFEDAQQQRIAATNRAERGGVDPIVYEAYTEALRTAEEVCALHMRRCFRRVVPAPIIAWQDATLGIGDHSLARLLGHLGHPVWATPHHWEGTGANRVLIADPPFARTVGQLWQYSGHGRPGRPQKGASAEDLAALGSPKLKMIVHLIAEAAVKAGVRKYPEASAVFTLESRYAISPARPGLPRPTQARARQGARRRVCPLRTERQARPTRLPLVSRPPARTRPPHRRQGTTARPVARVGRCSVRTAEHITNTAAVHDSREALIAAAEEWFAAYPTQYFGPQVWSEPEDKLRAAVDTYQQAVARDATARGDV